MPEDANKLELVKHKGWSVFPGRIPGQIYFQREGEDSASMVISISGKDRIEASIFAGDTRVVKGEVGGCPNIIIHFKNGR